MQVLERHPKLKRGKLLMQRSDGRSDSAARTVTSEVESTTLSVHVDE